MLRKFGQPGGGLPEWKRVQETIRPLILSCTTFPPMALRADPGAISTLWNYLPSFLSFGPVAAKINGPFSAGEPRPSTALYAHLQVTLAVAISPSDG